MKKLKISFDLGQDFNMSNTIKLTKYNSRLISESDIDKTSFFKITKNSSIPKPLRSKYALLSAIKNIDDDYVEGFGAYFFFDESRPDIVKGQNNFILTNEFKYLAENDVVRFTANHNMRVIYRKNASPNYLMVTEQCNSFCLMCSQPPKVIDDSHLYREYLDAIPLFDIDTPEIGISGGEPTIMKDQFIKLLETLNAYLPRTALHVLSNGKSFTDTNFLKQLTKTKYHDLMFGIPLYSHVENRHDYIVQDLGAFDKTVEGILNLKQFNQKVELRCVIQKPNSKDLIKLSEYIARNLQFVDQVAFMGLEATGFAKSNIDELWIEPADYIDDLEKAVWLLRKAHIEVKLFNHQLCLLPESLRKFSVKSISDWKTGYIDDCQRCSLKLECGGFFTTSNGKIPKGIRAFN